ncbi:MAG: Oxygenase, partial [Sphingomonas bacterium]|nr:Oxygenase [Sphingomonas bacterium]
MLFRKKSAAASAARQLAGRAVSQRLEANPRVQRAPLDTVQVYYHPNFLTAAQCSALCHMI